jgi:hypothetical protein
MPRWLTAILFALALAAQAITPVANGVAEARGVDLHALNEICLKTAGADHDHRHVPAHSHGHHDCALCQVFCDGVTPVVARSTSLAAARVQWVALRWAATDGSAPAVQRDYARQARAPPGIS